LGPFSEKIMNDAEIVFKHTNPIMIIRSSSFIKLKWIRLFRVENGSK